ncbi:MAG: adenine phosphoribosyltransferase [Candidatus Margulisbacteria bacterium]|nr:adenine phosphoribosyltransferase [Candidatus Margulisiibacteriota bacterium]
MLQKKIISQTCSFSTNIARSLINKLTLNTESPYKGGPGVNLDSIFSDPFAFNAIIDTLVNFLADRKITKIIGVADRGITIAAPVALRLGLPLVVAGKAGKMPGTMVSVHIFDKNSKDRLEILKELIGPEDKFALIDDTMTTGLTMAALSKLLEDLGGNIQAIASLVRFPDKIKKSWFYPKIKDYKTFSFYDIIDCHKITLNKDIHNYFMRNMCEPTKYNSNYSVEELINMIKVFPHVPYEGILWTDFSQILANPNAFEHACNQLIEPFKDEKIDKVLPIAVRGLHFGSVIASKLGVGQVIAAKSERLPGVVIKVPYGMEYNSAELGIPIHSIRRGDKILIVDDILATGGTVDAAVKLVESLGAIVVGVTCAIRLSDVFNQSPISKKFGKKGLVLSTLLNLSETDLQKKAEFTFF